MKPRRTQGDGDVAMYSDFLRPRFRCAGLLYVCVLCRAVAPLASGGDWRAYEVYQPTVTRHAVIDAMAHPHKYNHCATLAWFEDRWICLWGSHEPQIEHAPGQRIVFSTSRNGRDWTPIEGLFSNAAHCENPVLYPEGKGHQWQPNLGVVEGELWCLWNQGGSVRDFRAADGGEGPDLRGLYFSRLRHAGGKWVNRRLEWDGRNYPLVHGRQFFTAGTQNLCRLRSGRVLAPVTLYGAGGRAADAPVEATGWWAAEKIDTVAYTDDLGQTWRLSPGCQTPGLSWVQWEPTVWEQPDGSVMMFARHNTNWNTGLPQPPSGQFLLWSVSRDQGETWTPHTYVPIESVCSRMHVAPLDGRGAWEPAGPGDDYTGRRLVMVHNDAPGGLLPWEAGRTNLALFFARGHGLDFVAGNNISAHQPRACYPQMWRHDDTLGICYTTSIPEARSIVVALVSPLPREDRYYLFPRSNDVPRPEAPVRNGNCWTFDRGLPIVARASVDPGPDGFSFAAWVRDRGSGVLLDTRGNEGGFVIMLKARSLDGEGSPRLRRPEACLLTTPHEFGPRLPLGPGGEWHYIGLTADNRSGEALFVVDSRSEKVAFAAPVPRPLRGVAPHIGAKSLPASRLEGFSGDIRFTALYAGTVLGPEQHRWLHNRFAPELSRPQTADAAGTTARPLLWFDPADRGRFGRDFVVPVAFPRGGSEVAEVDGRQVLRFRDHGSAGVDLDENRRDRGDRVLLRFRFRLEAGDGQTLCTVGDVNQPARLIARGGYVLLCAGTVEQPCGEIAPTGWTPVAVESWANSTRARAGEGLEAVVRHAPEATWMYLGDGFPPYGDFPGSRFLVDVASVGTDVVRAPGPPPAGP
ncbi:MAG: exo-alpha-sialidase [Lentisphaeria bacterium]|nr:exo-alpha-sialidase [Lentisphaeria bacterium]